MRLGKFIGNSVQRKTLAVVFATVLVALLVNAVVLLLYELGTYNDARLEEVGTQAELLGRAAAPALAFNDRKEAQADLSALRVRPDVLAGVFYGADGAVFASYVREASGIEVPGRAVPPGRRVDGNLLHVSADIIEGNDRVGSVYVVTRSDLGRRIAAYLGTLALVTAFALGVAFLLSLWLQRVLTDPIREIDAAASSVVERRDFTVRAKRTTDDEIGVLAEAFNRMLAEVERRQDELRAADRRKDEFLATLAHELRNPLAPIRNAVYIMKLAPDNREAVADARALIERQLLQMVRLVDDLIDVSRITTGKLALRRERVEVAAVARSAIEAAEPLAKARGQALVTRLPPTRVTLNADATRLAQVFLNLLNNAIKFSEAGGRIDFEIGLEGGDLVARVRDAGIGISPESIELIFDMFAQADRSLERTAGGLGVGLALSRRLVELHGGTVTARSAGEGQGAEFTVRIPAASVEVAVQPGGREARQSGGQSKRHRILLADDNADFALSLASLLRGMGNEVHVEHDGAAALAAARQFRPDIAFLDIGMPQINGFDLARKLRELPETLGAILVAITGYSQPADRARAKECGFDNYFVKPVDVDRLRQILEG